MVFLPFGVGLCGFGGVFNIRRITSSSKGGGCSFSESLGDFAMVKYYLLFPSEQMLANMARVVILWSAIEDTIDYGIARLLHIPSGKIYQTLNPIRSFRQRQDIYRSLVEYEFRRGPKKLLEIKDLFVDIDEYYDLRNLIAHHSWQTWDVDNELLKIILSYQAHSLKFTKDKTSKKMIPTPLEIEAITLVAAIAEIPKTVRKINSLTREYLRREAKRNLASSRKRQ